MIQYWHYDDPIKYLILLTDHNSVHLVMRHIDAVTYDHQANQVAPNKHAKVVAFWGLRRLRARLKTCCPAIHYVGIRRGSDGTNHIFALQEMFL